MPSGGKTFIGVIVNGQIQVPPGLDLPENAKVLVIVPDEILPATGSLPPPHLVRPENAGEFKMKVERPPQ